MRELGVVLVPLHAQEHAAQDQRERPATSWPACALLARAASSASTIVTLEQISTNVLNAPIGSLRCTSCGSGQVGAPNRSTMYMPIKAGEEHDLGRQEQPHDQLAVGQRQAGLILQASGGRGRMIVVTVASVVAQFA